MKNNTYMQLDFLRADNRLMCFEADDGEYISPQRGGVNGAQIFSMTCLAIAAVEMFITVVMLFAKGA